MPLDTQQIVAAHRVAEGQMTKEMIAHEVGISRPQLYIWLKLPEFRAEVQAHAAEIIEASKEYGIASIAVQLGRMQAHYEKLLQVIEERAKVRGAGSGIKTGLIVKTIKGGRVVRELDTGLLAELREIEKEARQVTGQETKRLAVDFSGDSDDELVRRGLAALERARQAGIAGPAGRDREAPALAGDRSAESASS